MCAKRSKLAFDIKVTADFFKHDMHFGYDCEERKKC